MNLYSYRYKDTIYDFRMSYGAKLEIEKRQNMNYEIFEDKEVAKTVAKLKRSMKNDSDDLNEEEWAEVLPIMGKISSIGNELDPVQIGYILLKNNPKYKSLKEEEYLMIVNDMEENLGFEDAYAVFQEMYTKVFRLLEKLQVSRKEKEKKETKETIPS